MYNFFNDQEPGDNASMIRSLGGEVRKFALMNRAADAVIDYASGAHKQRDLDTEAKRLEILLRKRQLGFKDDDAYESLLNGELPRGAANSLMNAVPKYNILRPVYKDAYAIGGDSAPGIMDAFKGGLGNVSRSGSAGKQSANIVSKLTRFIR
jgi:hypothetical protein